MAYSLQKNSKWSTPFSKNFKKFQIHGTIFRKNIVDDFKFKPYNRAVGGRNRVSRNRSIAFTD